MPEINLKESVTNVVNGATRVANAVRRETVVTVTQPMTIKRKAGTVDLEKDVFTASATTARRKVTKKRTVLRRRLMKRRRTNRSTCLKRPV
jgi:hypothetical protein